MVRSNMNNRYGATNSAPPPPYSSFQAPTSGRVDWMLLELSRRPLSEPLNTWTKSRTFTALVTFIITTSLCIFAMRGLSPGVPVDPARPDKEEHERLNLSWGHVEAHQCTTYGKREYTAVLMNLPASWGQSWGWGWGQVRAVEACKALPLEIHGVTLTPKSCEDKGRGVVIGRWEMDQFEPDCRSFWIWYKDKGCTAHQSGKRRIEQYLENLPWKADWREFCATTPTSFHGMTFIGAQECIPINTGAWGYWEIDDVNC